MWSGVGTLAVALREGERLRDATFSTTTQKGQEGRERRRKHPLRDVRDLRHLKTLRKGIHKNLPLQGWDTGAFTGRRVLLF